MGDSKHTISLEIQLTELHRRSKVSQYIYYSEPFERLRTKNRSPEDNQPFTSSRNSSAMVGNNSIGQPDMPASPPISKLARTRIVPLPTVIETTLLPYFPSSC